MSNSESLCADTSPPFHPDRIQHPGIVTDTIGGLTLGRVLEALPNSPVAKGAWAESADPAEAVRILQPIPFLQVMGDTLIGEAIGDKTLTPEHARRLGAYAAASTIEGIARRHGTYGEKPFVEDILDRARRLHATAAREYRRADRPRVRSEALQMLEEPHRMQLAAAMMRQIAEQANALTLQKAACKAAAHMFRMDGEGEDAAFYHSPWESDDVQRGTPESLEQIVTASPFVRFAAERAGAEQSSVRDLTPHDMYAEGVRRTLAFVVRGVTSTAEMGDS